jgi:hypothetical protein
LWLYNQKLANKLFSNTYVMYESLPEPSDLYWTAFESIIGLNILKVYFDKMDPTSLTRLITILIWFCWLVLNSESSITAINVAIPSRPIWLVVERFCGIEGRSSFRWKSLSLVHIIPNKLYRVIRIGPYQSKWGFDFC